MNQTNGFESLIGEEFLMWLFALDFILYTLIFIGLFRFNYYARFLFLWFTVFGLIISFFTGWRAISPFHGVLIYMMLMLDGAILVFSYFTSVSDIFEKNRGAKSRVIAKPNASEKEII